ncbi:BspA family leucine-rich repeat surface protein [Bifidobacterium sp. B4001]|nr:BspA family leucine-rich repeat surface protein [Bifidobacterium sp. B4001]
MGMLAALGPVAPARADGGGGSLPPAAARAVREAKARKDPARLAAAAKAARPVVEPVAPAAARSAEPDGLVASGVWGSSPWEYRVENGQRVLTVHAGTIGQTLPPGDWYSGDSVADMLPDKGSGLSVIRIDPGVAAAYGSSLFAGLPSLLRIEGGGNLDVSKVTSTYQMFEDDVALQSVDVGDWDMSNVTYAAAMFKNCRSLRSLDVGNWNTSQLVVTGYGGYGDDPVDMQYDEDAVNATSGMFENDSMLTFLDVGRWDVGSLTNASGMFKGDTSLRYLDVSHWNTKPLSYSNRMFEHDAMLDNLDTSGWTMYSNHGTAYMFRDCGSLKYINLDHIAAYDSGFDSMVYMFADDPSLVSVDMSYSEYSAVKYIGHMFANDPALVSVNMSHTSFDELRCADYMFAGDKSLTDFIFNGQKSMFFFTDYSRETRLEHMFDGASSLSFLDLSALSSAFPEENPPYTHVHSEDMFAGATSLHTLVLPRDAYHWMANSGLPDVPAAGSRVPESSQVVASSRWVALNGSAKGSMYTSQQLMDMGPRPEATVYQWDMRDA